MPEKITSPFYHPFLLLRLPVWSARPTVVQASPRGNGQLGASETRWQNRTCWTVETCWGADSTVQMQALGWIREIKISLENQNQRKTNSSLSLSDSVSRCSISEPSELSSSARRRRPVPICPVELLSVL